MVFPCQDMAGIVIGSWPVNVIKNTPKSKKSIHVIIFDRVILWKLLTIVFNEYHLLFHVTECSHIFPIFLTRAKILECSIYCNFDRLLSEYYHCQNKKSRCKIWTSQQKKWCKIWTSHQKKLILHSKLSDFY